MSADISEPAAGSKKRQHAAHRSPAAPTGPADLVLATKAGPLEVRFDLDQVGYGEYTDFLNGRLTPAQDTDLLARASGLSAAQQQALTLLQFKRLVKALVAKVRAPLADPS